MTPQQKEELEGLIGAELDLCDPLELPTICAQNTPTNRAKLVAFALEIIETQKIEVSAALVALERQINVNMMED